MDLNKIHIKCRTSLVTISSIKESKLYFGFHPNFCCALDASPISKSTSATNIFIDLFILLVNVL